MTNYKYRNWKDQMKAAMLGSASILMVSAGLGGCAVSDVVGVSSVSNNERDTAFNAEQSKAETSAFLNMIGHDPEAILSVSPAALATIAPDAADYADARAMLENADMAAFMAENRKNYKDEGRSDAWGFAALDMLAAGNGAGMLTIVNAMSEDDDNGQVMTQDWLRPWALAAAGEEARAISAMDALKEALPHHRARGHMALMLEGMGRYEEALSAYEEGPKAFDLPDNEEAVTAEGFVKTLVFGVDRVLALRHAQLLRKLDRPKEAENIFAALLAADGDDHYTRRQLENLQEAKPLDDGFNDLPAALGLALNDEANALLQSQQMASVMFARGAEAPFNHFISALRQTALVLDPGNSGVRGVEVTHLHEHGHFEAAARLALIGEAKKDDRADLMLSAAESVLELDRMEEVRDLVNGALDLKKDEGSYLSAAQLLTRADDGLGGARMAAKALEQDDLDPELIAYAEILRSEALRQAGDVDGAILAARRAFAADDDKGVEEFMASMLVLLPDSRTEGLDIYRNLWRETPEDPGMMNNFGYSLVRDPKSRAELDEGYRLLKRANRLTPFEPNLLDSLGWAYYQYGDFERARKFIEQAIEGFAPFTHWELLEHHGDVLWRLGEKEDAQNAWREALESRPPGDARAIIESKLERGMTIPAPRRLNPPLVPKNEPVETNEI